MGDWLTAGEAQAEILAILARVPTQELPQWKEHQGDLWFTNLSMGWSADPTKFTNPERMAETDIIQLLACESASREIVRRAALLKRERSDGCHRRGGGADARA